MEMKPLAPRCHPASGPCLL